MVRLRWREENRRTRREQAFQGLEPNHVARVDQGYDMQPLVFTPDGAAYRLTGAFSLDVLVGGPADSASPSLLSAG